MVGSGQGDEVDPGVGTLARLGEGRAPTDDREHAPTARDDVVAVGPGARVEDVDALERIGVGKPADHATGDGRLGVALGCDDDAHGRVVTPLQRCEVGERPGRRSVQQGRQRRVEACEHHLGLGIAEARVELHDAHALGGECEPGVEQSREGRTAAAHLIDRGLKHCAHRLVD